MRHVVDVLEPPPQVDDRGQREGDPEVTCRDVPCSIKTLSGREAEVAHQLVATATHTVEVTGPIAVTERSILRDQATGALLHVGHVDDEYRNGFALRLICSEVKG